MSNTLGTLLEGSNISITKRFEFEAAHKLENHEGKCARLHGHSYKVDIEVGYPTLVGDGPSKGMVVDFTDLTEAVHGLFLDTWDHRFLGTWETPNEFRDALDRQEYIILPIPTSTAECLAIHIGHLFLALSELRGYIRSVTVWETRTSKATWTYSTPETK